MTSYCLLCFFQDKLHPSHTIKEIPSTNTQISAPQCEDCSIAANMLSSKTILLSQRTHHFSWENSHAGLYQLLHSLHTLAHKYVYWYHRGQNNKNSEYFNSNTTNVLSAHAIPHKNSSHDNICEPTIAELFLICLGNPVKNYKSFWSNMPYWKGLW